MLTLLCKPRVYHDRALLPDPADYPSYLASCLGCRRLITVTPTEGPLWRPGDVVRWNPMPGEQYDMAMALGRDDPHRQGYARPDGASHPIACGADSGCR